MMHINNTAHRAVGGAFSEALRTSILLLFFVVGFLFAACEKDLTPYDILIPPTTKNLGNALYKYGIVQIGNVVFKTEWSGESTAEPTLMCCFRRVNQYE